jgi:hypothetical protein
MKKKRGKRPSDLTDRQREIIRPYFAGMRNRKRDKRELVNETLYFEKTDCQRRLPPYDFPPFPTV